MTQIKYPILGYAPGKYQCRCSTCKDMFIGDKQSVICEPCAINALNVSHSLAIQTISELEKEIELQGKEVDRLKQYIDDCLSDK